MKKKLVALAAGVAAFGAFASPAAAADPSIAEIAVEAGSFNTLVAAVTAAGLVDALSDCDAEPITVFAPTDEAFAAALEALGLTAEQVLADTELLTTVLTYHVVGGAVLAETVVTLDGQEVATAQGESISISVTDAGVVLNGSINVVTTDIVACNGVIHVIDGVLLPPSLTATPDVDENLPATGSDNGTLALFAFGAAGLGALLLAVSRRRVVA
jgi:transforming growth factor-beta-induced protein